MKSCFLTIVVSYEKKMSNNFFLIYSPFDRGQMVVAMERAGVASVFVDRVMFIGQTNSWPSRPYRKYLAALNVRPIQPFDYVQ